MGIPKPRDKLIEKKAADLYRSLCQEYQTAYGAPGKTAIHMINDIAMLEQIKQQCREDIAKKGVMVPWQNGKNQFGDREHPLLTKINQVTEQQRRLLNDIKLTPASLKVVCSGPEAEPDEFEKFPDGTDDR